MTISFNHGVYVQYLGFVSRHDAHMTNAKAGSDVVTDLDHSTKADSPKRHAPAEGCFGYTQAHLVEPRACEMEAELFARFYTEPADSGSSRLVTKTRPGSR